MDVFKEGGFGGCSVCGANDLPGGSVCLGRLESRRKRSLHISLLVFLQCENDISVDHQNPNQTFLCWVSCL